MFGRVWQKCRNLLCKKWEYLKKFWENVKNNGSLISEFNISGKAIVTVLRSRQCTKPILRIESNLELFSASYHILEIGEKND